MTNPTPLEEAVERRIAELEGEKLFGLARTYRDGKVAGLLWTLRKLESDRTILNALSIDEERGWQPIETAPKDGDDILVEWNEGGTMLVVSWDEEAKRWATLDGLSYHPNAFKAWRALPEPSALAMSNVREGPPPPGIGAIITTVQDIARWSGGWYDKRRPEK